MAIKERVTYEDLALYEILRNPVLNTEFIENVSLDKRYDEEFFLTSYQREMIADFNSYVSFATARAVGKTVSLVSIIRWLLTFGMFSNDYILYTVPSKVHLQPVWEGLLRGFRHNKFLKNYVHKSAGINSSDYTIKLLNNQTLLCRIAGQSGTGSNVIGLHTPFILVDEGGYYPHNVFQEMQPSLNTFTQGFREMVAGVPTGVREKNVLYHVDQENANYTKHRVSAYDNPRNTPEDLERAIEQYGGEDTEDFVHYVLGQHGKPVFALFDRNLFQIESYPVAKLEIDGIKVGGFGEVATRLETFPRIIEENMGVIMGIDLGYTEPTAIIIMYVTNKGGIKFHGRIKLAKVLYPIQEKIIDFLDTKFNPMIIGIDRGQAGIPVTQTLLEHQDYIHKEYSKRLYPIDFSSWTSLGVSADGEEIKVKTKSFVTSVLQEYSNNHKIIYSFTDPDMIIELERMTYTKSPTGEIIYRTLTERGGKRGEDHFTSALLCGIGAYHLVTDFMLTRPKKRLMKSKWVI